MKNRKILGLGTIASLATPIVSVVACSSESHLLIPMSSVKKILSKYIGKDRVITIRVSGRGNDIFQIIIMIYDVVDGKLVQQLNFDGESAEHDYSHKDGQDVLRNQIEKIWDDLMKEQDETN